MSYSSTILGDSPTAYYRLDEGSGTVAADSSGNGKDGTYEGTRTQGATGLLTGDSDTAVSFAGAGDVLLPSDVLNIVGATDGFSMEGWFQTTMAGNGGIICGRATNGDPLLTISIQSGQLHYEIRDLGRHGTLTGTVTDTLFNDGVRHHVALTRDSSKVWRIYVDGVLLIRTGGDGMTMTTGGIASMNFSYIGWERTNNWRFNGTIDEVAVYKLITLTASQIAAHYTAGSGEATTENTSDTYGNQIISDGATAYYRLDEASGLRAVDASGNGKHGALRKGASRVAGIVPSHDTGAVSLDGTTDGRIDLPGGTFLASATDSLTIEAWISGLTLTNATIIGGRNPTNANPDLDLTVGNNGNTFVGSGNATTFTRDDTSSGTTGTLQSQLNSATDVHDGTLHHVVLTRDGSDKKWRLYVDGSLKDTSAADTMTSISGIDQLSIGVERRNTGLGKNNGKVDEVAIYVGVALSAGQVSNHYNLRAQSTLPFIASVTSVKALSLPDVPLPYIASVTSVRAPALVGAEAVPFIASTTTLHAPTLTGSEINVPAIASTTVVYGVGLPLEISDSGQLGLQGDDAMTNTIVTAFTGQLALASDGCTVSTILTPDSGALELTADAPQTSGPILPDTATLVLTADAPLIPGMVRPASGILRLAGDNPIPIGATKPTAGTFRLRGDGPTIYPLGAQAGKLALGAAGPTVLPLAASSGAMLLKGDAPTVWGPFTPADGGRLLLAADAATHAHATFILSASGILRLLSDSPTVTPLDEPPSPPPPSRGVGIALTLVH